MTTTSLQNELFYNHLKENSVEEIISNKKATFKFINEFNSLCDSYTMCKINVLEKKNNNIIYYDISYDYTHYNHTNKEQTPSSHPFPFPPHPNIHGTEISKNIATEQMIKVLLMSFDDIIKISGTTTPQRYKSNIMRCIDILCN
tara:strand:- start:303 stop:734 length:432 start_codon:yes stop_codon:yes gene_type:complete